jgi:hypothetical protein
MHDYALVKELLDQERISDAMPHIIGMMEDNPDDPLALNYRGYAHLLLDDDATAYQFFRRSADIAPNVSNLTNLGKALNEMGRHEAAIQYFMQAAEKNPDNAGTYANASATLIQMSQWQSAKDTALMALECDPDNMHAKINLAHAQLAQGEWKEGFANFDLALGGKFRREWSYDDKGRWNKEDGTVVVYGEQGLGDEIFYAQAIFDAAADARLIIDCDPKLAKLFSRSFKFAEVHGTRRDDSPAWLADANVDYRCAMGSLFGLYRKQDKDFAQEPWLVADPEKRMMWRALFDSYKKPVIGIALKSGTKKNNATGRQLEIEDFYPLMSTVNAVYVSLEYKGEDPAQLKSFPFATRSDDYDDTAAMISELDGVVGICTTALHCADALGVPTWTLVPTKHSWKFAGAFPLLPNQKFIYQSGKTWSDTVAELAPLVRSSLT